MPTKLSILSPLHLCVVLCFACPPQVAHLIVVLIGIYNGYFLKHAKITLQWEMYKSKVILMLHFCSAKQSSK